MLANTMAGENSIYTWTRDHRTHHKFSETHGDPHNAKVTEQSKCNIVFHFICHREDSSSPTWAGCVSGSTQQ